MPAGSIAEHPPADLSGSRVKRPDQPAVYWIDEGCKRLIPNPETFNNLFRDWNGILTDVPLDAIPDGPMVSNGAALVRPANSDIVYLIDRGTKRAVATAEAMERYHLNEKKVAIVPPILTDLIPNGKPLTVGGAAVA